MKNTKAEKVKNSSSHAEFISASTPNIMMLNKEEILNQVQDDNRRGFTLIELLVVVLIIGTAAIPKSGTEKPFNTRVSICEGRERC